MTITTEDSKTYTSKKLEKSKKNIDESQQFTVFSNSHFPGNFYSTYGGKPEKKLDSSNSNEDESSVEEHEQGRLSNIKEDSREYEERSDRKPSLADSGIDPSVLENGIYSRPFLVSRTNSGMVDYLKPTNAVNMQKKPEDMKPELSASRGSSVPHHSTDKLFENSNSVIQKIENILNKRQAKKTEKALQKITQSPQIKQFTDVIFQSQEGPVDHGPFPSQQKAATSIHDLVELSPRRNVQHLGSEKRSGSATTLCFNNSIYKSSPKQTEKVVGVKRTTQKRDDSFDVNRLSLASAFKKPGVHPKVSSPKSSPYKGKRVKRASNLSSTQHSHQTDQPKGGTASHQKLLTAHSLVHNLNLSGKNFSFSKVKGEKDLSTISKSGKHIPQKLTKPSSIRNSKVSSLQGSKIDKLLSQATKGLGDSSFVETSRTSYTSNKLKPKRIEELREETQLIISRLMNKKKPVTTINLDKEEQSCPERTHCDIISLPELDKEMSTCLFSNNLMKMGEIKAKAEASVNLDHDNLYSKSNIHKSPQTSSSNVMGGRSRHSSVKMKSAVHRQSDLKQIIASPLPKPKFDLLSPSPRIISAKHLALSSVERGATNARLSNTSTALDGPSKLKEVAGLLKKVRESPSLLMKAPLKKAPASKFPQSMDEARLAPSQ